MDSIKVIRWVVTDTETTIVPTWEPSNEDEFRLPENGQKWGGPWEPIGGAFGPDGLVYLWRRPVISSGQTLEARMAKAEQAAKMLDDAAQKHDALGEAVYAEVCRAQAEGIRDTLKILRGES